MSLNFRHSEFKKKKEKKKRKRERRGKDSNRKKGLTAKNTRQYIQTVKRSVNYLSYRESVN